MANRMIACLRPTGSAAGGATFLLQIVDSTATTRPGSMRTDFAAERCGLSHEKINNAAAINLF
jgi:hypothetical protein